MIQTIGGCTPHFLHSADREFRETNCYTDVLIELLHSRGLDPVAGLGHLVRTDFEGDQFTFFKMPNADLETLYGVDIHEMQPIGALPDQIQQQLSLGRTILVEVDSFFLPDTFATDYRRNNVKTTIAVADIDRENERLRYFHNTGCHELSGEDFRGLFYLDGRPERSLPPYLELARFDLGKPLIGEDLRMAARDCLACHLKRRPTVNPIQSFGERLRSDLPILSAGGVAAFHTYAFATVRMAGAAFDLLRTHLRWLRGVERDDSIGRIVEGCQILSFRLARGRLFETDPIIAPMADAWATAMLELERELS